MFVTRRRRLLAVLVALAALAASLAVLIVVRSPRASATVQIDVAKAVELANKARTVDGHTKCAISALTLATDIDTILGSVIATDEFRALPIAARLTEDDDVHHEGSLKALSGMCAWSVRSDPPALRVTVTASDRTTAERFATLLAKAYRDKAIDTATYGLSSRRAFEHESLRVLESSSHDQHETIDKLRVLAAEKRQEQPENADTALNDAARQLAYCEVLEREVAGLDKRAERQRAAARALDDLGVECNSSATYWIVPDQSLADSGWRKINRLEPTDLAFALANPAAGKDWLAGALSTRDRALAFAIDLPEVRKTDWMKSRLQKTAASGADRDRLRAEARRALAAAVTLRPFGDGSVVIVGLPGGFSGDDRRILMGALTQGFALDLCEQSSIDLLDRRDRLDRRITELGTELRTIEMDFQHEAVGKQTDAGSVSVLLDSSSLGLRLQQAIESSDALEYRRSRLSLEATTICGGAWMVKQSR